MLYAETMKEGLEMAGPIRSFIAFEIDDEEILNRFASVQEKLMSTGADLKPVKPQNIHITMRFLGDIFPPMVEKIHSQMESLVFSPFNVEIRRVGAFPQVKHPRIIWVGIQEGSKELGEIFDQLELNIFSLGFEKSSRRFSPHITIARVRTSRNREELTRCLQKVADFEFGVIKADCLKLKKSVLTPKGPIYSILKEVRR